MIARVVGIPGGGWLVRCDTCDHEQYAKGRPAAERLAREHNNHKHKEGQ